MITGKKVSFETGEPAPASDQTLFPESKIRFMLSEERIGRWRAWEWPDEDEDGYECSEYATSQIDESPTSVL